MKGLALGLFLAMAGGLWGVSPAFGKCETLYAEVLARIQRAEADGREPLLREQARQCAVEGLKRHGQNRHVESMATFRRCLKMFAE
jgi:hypothetical protein